MGLGTGIVYPILLPAISDIGYPSWRASALGVYRIWRDNGYDFGTLLGGVLADIFGIHLAIAAIALLTALSGLITFLLLPEIAICADNLRSKQAETLPTTPKPNLTEPRCVKK